MRKELEEIVHVTRSELAGRSVAAITVRGKELQVDETAGVARRLLAARAVKVVPVLDGEQYVGAVDRRLVATATSDDTPVGALAGDLLPVATETSTAQEALELLDASGGVRLVVLGADGATYVGLVCLRGDRNRLCVDEARLARGR